MHEHIYEMGIISMNGRIYDSLIGRFMSADPTIPHPYILQSFNRYSYVRNNPLRLTDPTGYDDGDGSDGGGWDGYSNDRVTTTTTSGGQTVVTVETNVNGTLPGGSTVTTTVIGGGLPGTPANTPVAPGSAATPNPNPAAVAPATPPTPQMPVQMQVRDPGTQIACTGCRLGDLNTQSADISKADDGLSNLDKNPNLLDMKFEKKVEKAVDTIDKLSSVDKAYKEGYALGEKTKQEFNDSRATIDQRISLNPDTAQGQLQDRGASYVRDGGGAFVRAVETGSNYPGNFYAQGAAAVGFYNGYTNCVCTGFNWGPGYVVLQGNPSGVRMDRDTTGSISCTFTVTNEIGQTATATATANVVRPPPPTVSGAYSPANIGYSAPT